MGSNTCSQMVPACFDLDEGFPKIANWYSSLQLPLFLLCMVIFSLGLSEIVECEIWAPSGRSFALVRIGAQWSISLPSSPSPVCLAVQVQAISMALFPRLGTAEVDQNTIHSLSVLILWSPLSPRRGLRPYRIHKEAEIR